jgi:hypothetical protein
MSLITSLLSRLFGQPHFLELADGLLLPGQAVLTWFEGEDRPLSVLAELGCPRESGHLVPFHERITSQFRMSSIGLLPSPSEAASYTL